MNDTSIFREDSGLAPVIGIVLLVSITVLLASTAAVFVLGFGDAAEGTKAPNTAFAFDYEAGTSGSDVVTVTHQSGDVLTARNVAIEIEGASSSGGGDPDGRYALGTFGFGASSEISAGKSVTLKPATLGVSGDVDFSSATIEVIWTGEGGSDVLRTWTGPDAE